MAVVCKSYATIDTIETYEPNGNVDRAHALQAKATKLGKSIKGVFQESFLDFLGYIIKLLC